MLRDLLVDLPRISLMGVIVALVIILLSELLLGGWEDLIKPEVDRVEEGHGAWMDHLHRAVLLREGLTPETAPAGLLAFLVVVDVALLGALGLSLRAEWLSVWSILAPNFDVNAVPTDSALAGQMALACVAQGLLIGVLYAALHRFLAKDTTVGLSQEEDSHGHHFAHLWLRWAMIALVVMIAGLAVLKAVALLQLTVPWLVATALITFFLALSLALLSVSLAAGHLFVTGILAIGLIGLFVLGLPLALLLLACRLTARLGTVLRAAAVKATSHPGKPTPPPSGGPGPASTATPAAAPQTTPALGASAPAPVPTGAGNGTGREPG